MSKRTIKQYNASKRYESSDKKTSALITVLGLTAIAGAGAVLYNTFASNPESKEDKAVEHTCDSSGTCDHYHHGGGFMYVGSGGTSSSMRSTSSFSSRPAPSAGVSRGFFGSIGGFVSG